MGRDGCARARSGEVVPLVECPEETARNVVGIGRDDQDPILRVFVTQTLDGPTVASHDDREPGRRCLEGRESERLVQCRESEDRLSGGEESVRGGEREPAVDGETRDDSAEAVGGDRFTQVGEDALGGRRARRSRRRAADP